MLTILLGALLMFGGLILLAAQPMFRARLSSVRRTPAATPDPTLEPSEPAAGFSLKETWPGLALIVVGGILLLVGW
ncbi:hypothetical protein YH63_014955 [Afipia massiliensis]|uniref:Uncharacterized protein n=1 Tax=Afipia massiliensis TaxID=211460 RepID=A0A4U6BRM7_9BRAD|nr:hypothetical protein [Afipia massiliensis]TKT72621.1 hypothetical protein YH63_014955 [Afipia massiliensis]